MRKSQDPENKKPFKSKGNQNL